SSTATVAVQQDLSPPAATAADDLNKEFFTLGQGFWSTPSRKLGRVRSSDLLKSLLVNSNDQTSLPLVVGKPGRSVKVQLESAAWLAKRLPADGKPRSLPDFGDQILSPSTGQTT